MNTGTGWHAGWHAGWHTGTVRTHQAFFSGSHRREILHCCSSYWETESISMQMQESQDQQTIEDHSRSHFASALVDVGWIQCMLRLEPFLIIFESFLVILESSRCLVRECESIYPNLSAAPCFAFQRYSTTRCICTEVFSMCIAESGGHLAVGGPNTLESHGSHCVFQRDVLWFLVLAIVLLCFIVYILYFLCFIMFYCSSFLDTREMKEMCPTPKCLMFSTCSGFS